MCSSRTLHKNDQPPSMPKKKQRDQLMTAMSASNVRLVTHLLTRGRGGGGVCCGGGGGGGTMTIKQEAVSYKNPDSGNFKIRN